ncbi:DUF2442 domain-containing protein [Vallitaleaceae bacterium 9-2]
MDYIQKVIPLSDYRLKVMMTNDNILIVDFKPKLYSAKYIILKDIEIFEAVSTDGNYIFWEKGGLKITAKEVIEVILAGKV